MWAGYLASHILEYFRRSFVERIDLSTSLSDEDGLNQLKPQAVLESKSHKPLLFLSHLSQSLLNPTVSQLRALNLDGVHLDDFDLTKIHHLLTLDNLRLNGTCIGNEGSVRFLSSEFD